MKKKKGILIVCEIFMIVVTLIFIYPIVLVSINSFKTFSEVITNVIALPKHFIFENYSYVWQYINYPRLFLNNLIITIVGVTGIVFFGSLAAYKLCRTKTKYSWAIFMFCIAPMLIPFQTIMITVVRVASALHLSNSVLGLGIQYWGFGAPLAVFIYHGFIKGIPREIDESAFVDGASSFKTFFTIIFPIMKPVTATIIIIDVMWIWNDFLLPLLMVNRSNSTKTLTLAAYSFLGEYVTDWQYTMTAVVMAVLPSIIFFIIMQKDIVSGVTSGSIKG